MIHPLGNMSVRTEVSSIWYFSRDQSDELFDSLKNIDVDNQNHPPAVFGPWWLFIPSLHASLRRPRRGFWDFWVPSQYLDQSSLAVTELRKKNRKESREVNSSGSDSLITGCALLFPDGRVEVNEQSHIWDSCDVCGGGPGRAGASKRTLFLRGNVTGVSVTRASFLTRCT